MVRMDHGDHVGLGLGEASVSKPLHRDHWACPWHPTMIFIAASHLPALAVDPGYHAWLVVGGDVTAHRDTQQHRVPCWSDSGPDHGHCSVADPAL